MTQLTPRKFKQSASVRNLWHAEPEFETPADALLKPDYWAHVSSMLRCGDIIVALAEEKTWWMEMLVLDAGKLFAKVIELRRINITQAQMLNVPVPGGFEIKFRGPRKWSVLRGKDVLVEDKEKPEAEGWLRDHIAALGVKAA